VKSQQNQATL